MYYQVLIEVAEKPTKSSKTSSTKNIFELYRLN